VEWSDINAALGQAAVLLCTITDKTGYQFKYCKVKPMGSFAKMVKVDDPTTKFNLYYDDNFTFFPKRNFNTALQSFLRCVEVRRPFLLLLLLLLIIIIMMFCVLFRQDVAVVSSIIVLVVSHTHMLCTD